MKLKRSNLLLGHAASSGSVNSGSDLGPIERAKSSLEFP